jgi:hypothetical protein
MTGQGVQSGQKMDNKTPTNSHYNQDTQHQQLNMKANANQPDQRIDNNTSKGIPTNAYIDDQDPQQKYLNMKTNTAQGE